MSEKQTSYAIWYDNSSGFYEPFLVIAADSPEATIDLARNEGLGTSVGIVATMATDDHNGFGHDPNADPSWTLRTR